MFHTVTSTGLKGVHRRTSALKYLHLQPQGHDNVKRLVCWIAVGIPVSVHSQTHVHFTLMHSSSLGKPIIKACSLSQNQGADCQVTRFAAQKCTDS